MQEQHEGYDTAPLAERLSAARVCSVESSDEVNEQTRRWLIGTSATDLNFKSLLLKSNAATIRAALAEIEGKPGHAGREKAMKAQLRKLLESEGEQVSSAATRQERAVALNVGELAAERERQQELQAEQQDRERRIAEAYEIAGRIQAMTFVDKVLTVSTLMQLKNIKESKAYRDLNNIGTWDKYCEYLGFSRQKVDMDLQNLAEFGEQFLLTVGSFGLGYRELRQLRQLRYDGESFQIAEDGKSVIIEGSEISLSDDAAPEIEAALEKLLEKNRTLRERNTKLERDLRGAVKEETAGLLSEKKALLERVKALEQYEPKAMDETRFEEQYAEIHGHMSRLATSIHGLLDIDDLRDNPALIARVDGYVEAADTLITQLRDRWADMLMFENK